MPFQKGHKFSPGRKKGSKHKRTIELEAAQEQLRQAILKNITPLTVAAMNAALGERFIYRIDRDSKGKEKPPELVNDPHEIERALDAIENDSSVIDESYYYISTKPMNTHALQQLFDRAFGKAKETKQIDMTLKLSLSDLAKRALERRKKKNDPV